MNTVRHVAAWTYRMLITLFAAAVIVEFFLAGLGIFRAMPGDNKAVSHETFDDKFDAHAAIGDFLGGGSLLLLGVILVAWAGPRWIGATVGLAILTFAQGALGAAGDNAPVAGAFHAINALLILGLSLYLTTRAWRGNLLTPLTQHPPTPPPPAAAPSTPASRSSRSQTGTGTSA